MPRVAFIMVNHNGGEETLHSVRSLVSDLGKDDLLYLVDNGTSDGSGKVVKKEYPSIVYLENHENMTFSGANNRGIREALERGFRYIGLINPDIRTIPGMVQTLVEHLEMFPQSGAVSPIMYYESPANTIWSAGGTIHWNLGWAANRGLNKPARAGWRYHGRTEFLSGCCWLARREAWERVGLLDETYAMYAEDVDWCYRAGLAGFRLDVDNRAKLIHRISQSSGGGRSPFKMMYRTMASRLFFSRYSTLCQRIAQKSIGTVANAGYAFVLAAKGEFRALKTFVDALRQPLPERISWPPKN